MRDRLGVSRVIRILGAWALGFAAVEVLGAQPTPLDPREVQANTYTWVEQSAPAVAVDPGGSFVVVWWSSGNDAGGDLLSVRARRFRPDGTPKDPRDFQVSTYSTFNLNLPAVAADAAGNFVVAWQSAGSLGSDDDGYSIQARRFSAAGAPLDAAEFQVNTYTYDWQIRPSVAADARGDFVVVWDSWEGDGSGYGVAARRYATDGTPLSAEFQVNTITHNSQLYSAVAASLSGEFVVAWEDGNGVGSNIRARRFAADGAPLDPAEFQVNTYTLDYGFMFWPEVAMAPDGGFIVVWESERYVQPYNEFRVFARRFGDDGLPLDPVEFQVNSLTHGYIYQMPVAMDPEGNFVVAWDSYASAGGDDSLRSVQARRYRRDGTAVDADQFQVNTYTTDAQGWPRVAVAPDGNFVLVWASNGSWGDDDSYSSVQFRRYGRPTIPVTSSSGGTGGPGCTLRDAIAAANAGQPVGGCPAGNEGAVVELPAGSSIALTEADNGSNALPLIRRPVTIRGHGSRIERDPGLACPIGPEFRLFEVPDGGILELEDVSVSNGCLPLSAGGGVLSSGGTLVLRKASIEGNESGADGGGVAAVGGNLIAYDSTVRGNLSGAAGGGLAISGDPDWVLLDQSTVSENLASSGGGLSFSGSAARAPLLVRNSTFSGNDAAVGGGAIELSGASPAMTLDFSTVVRNASPSGAGVFVGSGVLSLHGSLVGENLAGADCAFGAGGVGASGANLDTDGSCAALAGGNVTTVPSLGLGPLADNGGWVRTHLPLPGSPALDAAPVCELSSGAALAVDARGYPRPTDDDGDGTPACDLGAVERGPVFLDGFESGDLSAWSRAGP